MLKTDREKWEFIIYPFIGTICLLGIIPWAWSSRIGTSNSPLAGILSIFIGMACFFHTGCLAERRLNNEAESRRRK